MEMLSAKHSPPTWVGSDDRGIDLGSVTDVRIDCCRLKRDVGQRNYGCPVHCVTGPVMHRLAMS